MLWYLTVVLICKFVMIYDVEHFSYAYLQLVYLVLVRYPDFCLFFLIGLFYYFDFKSCFVCFLDNSPLSDVIFMNIFSTPMSYPFIHWTVSFTEQKFLI